MREQLPLPLDRPPPRRCPRGHVLAPGNLVVRRSRGKPFTRCRTCVNAEARGYMKNQRWSKYVERSLERAREAIVEVTKRGGPKRAARAVETFASFAHTLNIRSR